MKHIIKKSLAALLVLTAGMFSACQEVFDESTALDLARLLEPMNLTARVDNLTGDEVTFKWDMTEGADLFALEIFLDQTMEGDADYSYQLSPDQVPYKQKLEADKEYYYRVQARSSKDIRQPSNWAVAEKSFKTYAVKPCLYPKVTARTESSFTVSWTPDPEVDHIEYRTVDSEETIVKNLTEAEISAGSVTVSELTSTTNYFVALYYLSANRGELDLWTMPSVTGATEVSDAASFKKALADKATKILVKSAGSPYTVEAVEILKGVEIYGEETAEGTRPVIFGEFSIPASYEGGAIYFESVELNGAADKHGFTLQLKEGAAIPDPGMAIESIKYKNCNITGYSKGLLYEWNQKFICGELTYENCDIFRVNAECMGGGDGIDLRIASSFDEINIINNTIYNSFRTFLRMDASVIAGDVTISNNTLMTVSSTGDGSNNGGLMGMKCKPASVVFKNNLVLNQGGKATVVGTSPDYLSADEGIVFSNNHYYNYPEAFFNTKVTEAQATAGGGSILASDPCFNSKGGFFNLVDADLLDKKVGASKWWVTYVEEVEDLTLPVISSAKTWNFGDAKYFTGEVAKSKVRDGLLMSVIDNKLKIEDGTIAFTAASALTKKRVPTDGYVAFKVDAPGSVYIGAVDAANTGAHLVVATGAEGATALTVKGGVVATQEGSKSQKILITDITEETIVYIYASGKINLSALAWALDTTPINTSLPTPEPSLSVPKVTQGTVTDVEVTWEPVDNAGSYSVVFGGKTYPVDEGTSYTIPGSVVKFLDAGSHMVEVYANPAEGDIYNTQSAAGKVALTIASSGASEGTEEFVVSSVEDLKDAIASGKSDITLEYSATRYELGSITLTAPLRLKGQIGSDGKYTPIRASFKLSGNVQCFTLKNLDLDGTSAEGAVIIDDKDAVEDENGYQVVADTVAIYDSYIHDGAARLYDNSGKAKSCVQNVIFKGVLVENYSAGNDMIDFRAGHYHKVAVINSTFTNSARTFIRTDAGSEINYLTVVNNTFHNLCKADHKDNNGVFHVRGTAGSGMIDFRIINNLFYSFPIEAAPTDEKGNGYPKFISGNSAAIKPNVISNNYFYNIEEREEKASYSWWTANCSREEGLAGGGAVLPADPCKDVANGDFTLTNAVAMNSNIGDPRWNPMRGKTPASEITVDNVTDFLTAISAGKKTITLNAGTYDLDGVTDVTEVASGKLTIVSPLNIVGKSGAKLKGSFVISGENVTNFSISGLEIEGIGDYLITMADNSAAGSIALKNITVYATGGLIYGAKDKNSSVNTLEVSGSYFDEIGAKDFIDFRNSTTLNALRVVNNTFANGIRTFLRLDANCTCNSVEVRNNTFYNNCFTDSKDNNGIFHVQSPIPAASYNVTRNLFASMKKLDGAPTDDKGNGYPKLISVASKVLPSFAANYYYDITTEGEHSWWTKDKVTAKQGLAGYGILLAENPFKDAANRDFTLTNALAISERIGDQRWNPNKTVRPEDWFTVNGVTELLDAINAGKQNVELAYAKYDLTDEAFAIENGKLAVTTPLNIRGKMKDGLRPVLIGGFTLSATDLTFSAANIAFDGNADVDNFLYIADAATVNNISLRNNKISNYKNRLIYQDKETTVTASINVIGNIIDNMGTGGDFIDVRKGTLKLLNVRNNTIANGIRTFIRMDANVICGAITVQNNTFYNLCSVVHKDNNGIFHVRSSVLNETDFIVKNNLFASMHRLEDAATDSGKSGYPKLLANNNASKVPTFVNNLYYDIETNVTVQVGDPLEDVNVSWFAPGKRTDLTEDAVMAAAVAGGGAVLTESPFVSDPATGKYALKVSYDGIGDPRW